MKHIFIPNANLLVLELVWFWIALTCIDVLCFPLQVMEFYCESCETAMCLDCTEGEHREHVTVPLRDVLEQHKAALKNQLDAIRNRYHTLSRMSIACGKNALNTN